MNTTIVSVPLFKELVCDVEEVVKGKVVAFSKRITDNLVMLEKT